MENELVKDYELPSVNVLSVVSTLELLDFVAFTVMCSLEIYRQFQEERHKPQSKLCAAIFLSGDFVLLVLGIVFWGQDDTFQLFTELIPGVFLIFYNYRHKEWRFKGHFKIFCQTMTNRTPESQTRKKWRGCLFGSLIKCIPSCRTLYPLGTFWTLEKFHFLLRGKKRERERAEF